VPSYLLVIIFPFFSKVFFSFDVSHYFIIYHSCPFYCSCFAQFCYFWYPLRRIRCLFFNCFSFFLISFSWTLYGLFSYLSPPFILCPCPFVLSISLFCSPSFLLYLFLLSRNVISRMQFHFLAAHISRNTYNFFCHKVLHTCDLGPLPTQYWQSRTTPRLLFQLRTRIGPAARFRPLCGSVITTDGNNCRCNSVSFRHRHRHVQSPQNKLNPALVLLSTRYTLVSTKASPMLGFQIIYIFMYSVLDLTASVV
jgi:hypothetical protein